MKPITSPTPLQVEKLRNKSGLTAEAFGALVYAERNTVYSWEKGRRECPPATWELLLIYFGKAQPRRQPEAEAA